MMAPEALASFTAASVAERTGSSVKDREPKWKIPQVEIRSRSSSAGVDLGVRTGFAGKGKAPLAGFGELHKGQRGKIAGINQQRPGIHTDALERLSQKAPLQIVAHFADKGGAAPQLAAQASTLAGAPPGFCSKTAMPASESGRGGVVNQNFAQRDDICRCGRALRRAMGNVVVHAS